MSVSSQPLSWLLVLMVLGSIPVQAVPVPRCPSGRAPKGSQLGRNRQGRQPPLFALQVEGTSLGYDPSLTYKVSVAAGVAFSDASVKLRTSGGCGLGQLTYLPEGFTQASGCPHFLSTNRKDVMSSLPRLQWTPPQCGCVTFSVTIRRQGVYYLDKEGVTNDDLTKTVCPDTREGRLRLLCHAAEQFSGASLMERPDFRLRHGLDASALSSLSLERLELALEQRRADIRECCHLSGTLRGECFADVRRRRIDRFCGDGYPDIPFTSSRSEFMVLREADCCWELGFPSATANIDEDAGVSRYGCFSMDATEDRQGKMADTLDYSLDESDPANDLGDYSSELAVLQQDDSRQRSRNAGNVTRSPSTKQHVINSVKTAARVETTTTSTTSTTSPVAMAMTDAPRRKAKVADPVSPRVSKDEGVAEQNRQRTFDLRASRQLSPLARETIDAESARSGSSSVEETLNGWRRKFHRIQLKLRCCEEGRRVGEGLRGKGEEITWSRCPRDAKMALSLTKGARNKRKCRKNFLRCCVEEARTPTTIAWSPAKEDSSTASPEQSKHRSDRQEDLEEFSPLVQRLPPQPVSRPMTPLARFPDDVKNDDVKSDDDKSDVDEGDYVKERVDDVTSSPMTSPVGDREVRDDVRRGRITSVEMTEVSGDQRGPAGERRGGKRGKSLSGNRHNPPISSQAVDGLSQDSLEMPDLDESDDRGDDVVEESPSEEEESDMESSITSGKELRVLTEDKDKTFKDQFPSHVLATGDSRDLISDVDERNDDENDHQQKRNPEDFNERKLHRGNRGRSSDDEGRNDNTDDDRVDEVNQKNPVHRRSEDVTHSRRKSSDSRAKGEARDKTTRRHRRRHRGGNRRRNMRRRQRRKMTLS